MQYNKPHLSYTDQLTLLKSRGLDVADDVAALAALKEIGYYRFSAYLYPFRELLGPGSTPGSPVQFRSDQFAPGSSFEQARELYDFDQKLRMVTMEGARHYELALRAQISYVLGKRDPHGHMVPSVLNLFGPNNATYDVWVVKYNKLVSQSKMTDFVRHFLVKYNSALPVWVAVEVMDFGSLTRLFEVMNKVDKNEIARHFGVKTGDRLDLWHKSLNYLRNKCAHHSRLWNANLLYEIGAFPPAVVGPSLSHVATNPNPEQKLYRVAAILAYMLRESGASPRWAYSFRERVLKLPAVAGQSPESNMGFPTGWGVEPLWAR